MRRSLAFIFVLLTASAASAQTPANDDATRLIAVGKLWVTIKYFHPYLAYKNVNWDEALVHSLPAIRAANDPAAYAAALNFMLRNLGDPGTYASVDSKPSNAGVKIETKSDGTVTFSSDPSLPVPKSDPTPEVIRVIEAARSIVFDLRTPSKLLAVLLDQPSVASTLIAGDADLPGERTWVHQGLTPAGRPSSPFYFSSFSTRPGLHIAGKARSKREIVFILGEGSQLPAIGCMMVANGQARITAEGEHYRISGSTMTSLPMGSGVSVALALSEPIFLDGTGFSISGARRPLAAFPMAPTDSAYPETRYPSTEYRILAAYKIWGVFHYFFAYRDLMDEDWDEVFERSLPKLGDAKTARDYHLQVAEMITHVADSHATVHSAELADYFGTAPVGLRLRLIDKKPIITEVLDPEARKAGVLPGDVITAIDGENAAARINREASYTAAATQQSLAHIVTRRVLNGSEGSTAALTITGEDGVPKHVSLAHSRSYADSLRHQHSGDVYRVLAGNIGYVDLDRLTPGEVDAMFEKLWSTAAIIFDMRGYPNGTGWAIAARLTDKKEVPAALFNGPLALTPDILQGDAISQSASYFFVQTISHRDKPTYKGKTVMLIDESTISQAEHTGLLFEAANKTEFIGSPSAGANGEISSFIVPGGITIAFSGQDVRHANGGPLQRLGLQPAVTVRPTVNGIRAGRDEVLEKAQAYLGAALGQDPPSRVARANESK
ncbi:MAG: hypothetical protein JO108_03425 [Acidobacteriaceae bacterium]|nr:hypothetical protein [Acidobacteriaceae bacterium]